MDLTTMWVQGQKHKSWLGPLIVGGVLFIAGWFTGRAMSPYYAAHPIVFDEKAEENVSAGGAVEDLVALQAVGESTPQPAVAAAQTSMSEAKPTTSPALAEQKLFVASINSDLYHHRDCPSAKRIKEENQVWFASEEQAQAAGYSASKCTLERKQNTQ